MEEDFRRLFFAGLFLLIIALMVLTLYVRIYGMARIYNWNGRRYCYLGTAVLHRQSGAYMIRLGERMVDLSHTTLYRVCPSRAFCTKNRYKDLFVYLGNDRRHLIVDTEPMQAEIPFV